MVYEAKSGHIGGSFSLAELFAYLYSEYNLTDPNNKDGDILILSKGHAAPIIYATLNQIGVLTDDDIKTFRQIDSKLQGHPHCIDIPEVHASTGSLGQGLSIAIGRALAKKKLNNKGRVFCIIGDGEMQEGQVWEALLFLGNQEDLNITIILDDNKYQNDNTTDSTLSLGKIKNKIESFNIKYHIADGQSVEKISSVFRSTNNQISFIHLETIKGAGVEFMNGGEWHAKIPNKEEYEKALKELNLNYN